MAKRKAKKVKKPKAAVCDVMANIMNAMLDSLVVSSPEGEIKTVNKAMLDLLGYTEEELIGQSIEKIVKPASGGEPMFFRGAGFKKLIAKGRVMNQNLLYITRDGREVPATFNGSIMKDEEGGIVGIVGVARDMGGMDKTFKSLKDSRTATLSTLADVSETRDEFHKSYERLKQLDVLRDEFISIGAHELKTPLVSIIGSLELLLRDETLTDKQRKKIELAHRAALRENQLVNDILDISKLDSGSMKFDIRDIDIEELIRAIRDDLASAVKEEKNSIVVKVPQKLPMILGDRHRITQALSNLIINANKFTDNGTITITAKKDRGNIVVSVADTGIGIEMKHLANLFTKFYQVDSSITREHRGTGLGLAICKEIILAHGGRIWVESTPGKGSTFTFTLPIESKLVKGRTTISLEDYRELETDLRKRGLKFMGETPLDVVGVLEKGITLGELEEGGYITMDYEELVRQLIRGTQKLLGPMAIAAANNVPDLLVSPDCKTIEITGDEKEVIQALISTYERVVGPITKVIVEEEIKKTLTRKDIAMDYKDIIKEVIDSVEKLLGPMAIAAANNVQGLTVKPDGEIETVGNEIQILRDLVSVYERVVGSISEVVVEKELIKRLFKKNI